MMKILAVFLALILIISFGAISSIPPSTAQSGYVKELDYKIIFTQLWRNCNAFDNAKIAFYTTVVDQYLKKYLIKPNLTGTPCVNGMLAVDQIAGSTDDLIIIVPDIITYYFYTQNTQRGGHYTWGGDDRFIVSSSVSFYPESIAGAWIMSHELAHFSLHYLGYSDNFMGNWVHQTQTKYTDCLKLMKDHKHCTEFWTTIRSPIGNYYPVMAIYDGIYDLLEKPVITTSQLPTYFTSPLKTNTEYIIPNGSDVCTYVKLQASDGTPLKFVKIKEKVTMTLAGGYPQEFSRIHTTDKNGQYSKCQESDEHPAYLLPIKIKTYFTYDGNQDYRPAKSGTFQFLIVEQSNFNFE